MFQSKHFPNRILDPPSPLTKLYSPVFVTSENGTTIHPVTQAKHLIILSIKCISESDSSYFIVYLECNHFSPSPAGELVKPPSPCYRNASPCVRCTVRPNNTKTPENGTEKGSSAGPCKKMGAPALKKNPKLPESFQQSPSIGKVREGCG